MLSCELVDSEVDSEIKSSRPTTSSDLYRTTFYDYTTNRTIIVDGHLNKRSPLNIIESNRQPMPSNEEFDEAVEILMRHSEIGSAIRKKTLQIYRPMPPLINEELPDGRIERTIAIGLLPEGNGPHQHEIVGVNMIHQTVVRFEGGAPKMSMASNQHVAYLLQVNPLRIREHQGRYELRLLKVALPYGHLLQLGLLHHQERMAPVLNFDL